MKRNGVLGPGEHYAPAQPRMWVPPSLRDGMRNGINDLCGMLESRAWSKPGDTDSAVRSFLEVFPESWVAEIVGPDFMKLTAREVLARLEDHHG